MSGSSQTQTSCTETAVIWIPDSHLFSWLSLREVKQETNAPVSTNTSLSTLLSWAFFHALFSTDAFEGAPSSHAASSVRPLHKNLLPRLSCDTPMTHNCCSLSHSQRSFIIRAYMRLPNERGGGGQRAHACGGVGFVAGGCEQSSEVAPQCRKHQSLWDLWEEKRQIWKPQVMGDETGILSGSRTQREWQMRTTQKQRKKKTGKLGGWRPHHCAYCSPLWQCFLRNWKTFLTTFSTSLKGCCIRGWSRGVKCTTPTSTCTHRTREEIQTAGWLAKATQTKKKKKRGDRRLRNSTRDAKTKRDGRVYKKPKEEAVNKMTQHDWLASQFLLPQ